MLIFPEFVHSLRPTKLQIYAYIGVYFLPLFLVDQRGQSVALFVCGAYHGSRGSGRIYRPSSSAFRNCTRACGGGRRVRFDAGRSRHMRRERLQNLVAGGAELAFPPRGVHGVHIDLATRPERRARFLKPRSAIERDFD